MDDLLPSQPKRLLVGNAAVLREAVVVVVVAAVGGRGPDHLRDGLGEETVLLFAALQRLVQLRIVDRDGGLAGDAQNERFIRFREYPGLFVSEEQPAEDIASPR